MKRAPVRFSMATLLLVVTVASLWLGRLTYIARRRIAALQAITASDGLYRDESDQSAPQWLKDLVGEKYFETATVVDFAKKLGRKRDTQEFKADDDVLRQLKYIDDIEHLELGNNESIGDEQLAHLRPLKNLKTIHLYQTCVLGAGLVHLADLSRLESVSLSRSKLHDEGMVYLARIPNLRWLRLDNTQITDAGVADLAGAENLQTLSLNNTKVTDRALAFLEDLSGLTELGLKGTQVTYAGVRSIQASLPNCQVSYDFALGKVPDDRALFPADSQPSVDEIRAVLKARKIGVASVDSNQSGSPIVSLHLDHTTLSDSVLASLIEHLPKLKSLVVRTGMVGDALFEQLPILPDLEYVELVDTMITDDALRGLSRFARLRELNLSDTDVTDEGIQHLAGLKGLEMLSVENTQVTQEGIEKLRRALPKCRIYQ